MHARSLLPSRNRPWDDTEIYRLLTKAPTEELKFLLSGTVAGPSVSGSISLGNGEILYEHIGLWNRIHYLKMHVDSN